MFGSHFKPEKCSTELKLALSRIKIMGNRKKSELKILRRDIAKQIETGQESSARIRVENVVREQNLLAAYEILELFIELLSVRLNVISSQKECPVDLREAVSSLIFAAPRCSEISELMHIKQMFASKYGKDFVASAEELRPECGVNRTIIEKLSVRAPTGVAKLALLKEIASENNVEWDSSKSEEALIPKRDDLLDPQPQYNSSHYGPPSYSTAAPAHTPPPKWVDPEALSSTWVQGGAPQPPPDYTPQNSSDPYSKNLEPVAGFSVSSSLPPSVSSASSVPSRPSFRHAEEERDRLAAMIRETGERAKVAAKRAADAARSAVEVAFSGLDHKHHPDGKSDLPKASPDSASDLTFQPSQGGLYPTQIIPGADVDNNPLSYPSKKFGEPSAPPAPSAPPTPSAPPAVSASDFDKNYETLDFLQGVGKGARVIPDAHSWNSGNSGGSGPFDGKFPFLGGKSNDAGGFIAVGRYGAGVDGDKVGAGGVYTDPNLREYSGPHGGQDGGSDQGAKIGTGSQFDESDGLGLPSVPGSTAHHFDNYVSTDEGFAKKYASLPDVKPTDDAASNSDNVSIDDLSARFDKLRAKGGF